MNYGTRLREIRTAKKMSVYKLSKLSDISENYIHAIEKGKSQPSIVVLERLLAPLSTTLLEFLNEDRTVMYPTPFECSVLEGLRVLDEEKASAVLTMIRLLAK